MRQSLHKFKMSSNHTYFYILLFMRIPFRWGHYHYHNLEKRTLLYNQEHKLPFLSRMLRLVHKTLWYMCSHIRGITQALLWRHNGRDGVPNHQPHDCLLNRPFRRRSKKTSKLRVTGLCAGNSPVTGEFPAQMGSNAENVSIWWHHHDNMISPLFFMNTSVLLMPFMISTCRVKTNYVFFCPIVNFG